MNQYDALRPQLRTYDFVLFSGTGVISSIIKAGSASKWSHVGFILRTDDFPESLLPKQVHDAIDDLDDRVLLMESTTLSNIADLVAGKGIKGVQIVPLSERVKTYDGEIAWRQVVGPRPSGMFVKTSKFIDSYHGTPYEESQLELARSALDLLPMDKNQEDTHSLFCSEMVAFHHRFAGLFEPYDEAGDGTLGWPDNEFTPADFAGKSELPWQMEWGAGRVVPILSD